MQLALSTTIAPPPLPVWDELSGNLRQGFTTKNQGWNPGPNVVNSTTAIGFWPSLFLEGFRQSHSARYYNPLTGRFMSRDPEDGDPTDPATLHKYLYAGGDPVDGWDPTGRADLIETIKVYGKKVLPVAAAAYACGKAIYAYYQLINDALDNVYNLPGHKYVSKWAFLKQSYATTFACSAPYATWLAKKYF